MQTEARTWCTLGLILALAGIYAWQSWTAEVEDGSATELAFSLLRSGGINRFLIYQGEVHRLVAGVLLHASLFHLFTNMFFLAFVGHLLEGVIGIGRVRFLLIFTLAGLAGATLSLLLGRHFVLVGASGALYGLVGAYAYLRIVHRDVLPATFSLAPGRTLEALVVALSVLGFFTPGVDLPTHLGGLVAGSVTMAALARREGVAGLNEAGTGARVACAILVLLYCAGASFAFAKAQAWDASTELEFSASVLSTESDWITVNAVAWRLAMKEESSREVLLMARDRMEEMVERTPLPELRDTLAQLHYRLGDYEKAVVLQRTLLAETRDPRDASRLALFEEALSAAREQNDPGVERGRR